MNWRRRALGYAVALVLSVSVVAPVGAASAREERTAGGLVAVWSDLETLWHLARTFWFGLDSATSATTAPAAGEPVADDDADTGGTGGGTGARGGGGSGGANSTQGGGGAGGGDGSGSYDPNGG